MLETENCWNLIFMNICIVFKLKEWYPNIVTWYLDIVFMVISMFVRRWFVFSCLPLLQSALCISSFGSLCWLFSPLSSVLYTAFIPLDCMTLNHVSYLPPCDKFFHLRIHVTLGIQSIVEAEQRHSKYFSQYGFACLLLNPYCCFLLLKLPLRFPLH